MDEAAVRAAAQQFGDALVEGNVDTAIEHLSDELKRNLGEVVALLPLPATEVEITSFERATSAIVVVLRVTSETAETDLQTRWKDRDDTPRIVEIGHLQRVERAAPSEEATSADAELASVPD
jgi:hypothetical protein